jgi:Ca-activated chloride channel family protein
VKVGMYRAFASSAQVAQPTHHQPRDLVTAIDPSSCSAPATGNAIVMSLATLFPDAPGSELRVAADRP